LDALDVKHIRTTGPEETVALGREIGRRLEGGELILLSGDLGAGKTQLVRGIAEGAGCPDDVASPTFVLERRYEGRVPIRHIDLYRIRPAEIEELAIEESRADGASVIVEWGEKLATPTDPVTRVRIDFEEDADIRVVSIGNPPVAELR
jgi:tRNA threonylcarbamoyladenosine biosynthesis protein TsaE